MSALPPLNRGGEAYRSHVAIWSKQVDAPPPPGKRGQQRSPGNRRREFPEGSVAPASAMQQRRTVALQPVGNAEAIREVSVAAVRPVVPTTAVELRVAYGIPNNAISLEVVPNLEVTTDVAVTGDTALATGRVHRFAADFYARATSVGYPGRRGMVGTNLDTRV